MAFSFGAWPARGQREGRDPCQTEAAPSLALPILAAPKTPSSQLPLGQPSHLVSDEGVKFNEAKAKGSISKQAPHLSREQGCLSISLHRTQQASCLQHPDSPRHLAGTVWPQVQILHQPPESQRPLGKPRARGYKGAWTVQAVPGRRPSLPGSSQRRGPRGCTRWAAVPTKSPPSTTRIVLSGRVSSTSCSTRTGFRCWATGIDAFSLPESGAHEQGRQESLPGTHNHNPDPRVPRTQPPPKGLLLLPVSLPKLLSPV